MQRIVNFYRQNKIISFALVAVLFSILLYWLIRAILMASLLPFQPASRGGGPAPQIWQLAGGTESMQSRTREGEFEIKYILVSPVSIRYFFTMKLASQTRASQPAAPLVTATSIIPRCTGGKLPATPLNAQVQLLGTLGDFTVGVIHVNWKDQLDQLISLKVQPPVPNSIAWDLAALQQINPSPLQGSTGIYIKESIENPMVVFSGVGGREWNRQAAILWLDRNGQPNYSPPLIFIEVEQADIVTVINQDKYIEIAGPIPSIYNRPGQYPATPTLPGFTPPSITLKTPCQ